MGIHAVPEEQSEEAEEEGGVLERGREGGREGGGMRRERSHKIVLKTTEGRRDRG